MPVVSAVCVYMCTCVYVCVCVCVWCIWHLVMSDEMKSSKVWNYLDSIPTYLD